MPPESSSFPSTRLDRRQALAWLAVAAVGLTASGRLPLGAAEPSDRPHGKRIGADPVLNKTYVPGELWPLSFTSAQRAAADALADLILPPEAGGKKPSELGVPAFRLKQVARHYFTRWTTDPAEMMAFTASSMDIVVSRSRSFGTMRRNPVVGFGVVGTNTFTMSCPVRARISAKFSDIRNPMLQAPLRGNSTITTCLNEVPLSVSTVSLNVFAPP